VSFCELLRTFANFSAMNLERKLLPVLENIEKSPVESHDTRTSWITDPLPVVPIDSRNYPAYGARKIRE
jgi:hypothetical protein